MSTQFLFRPHIDADGMVVTPDLALSRLVVVLGGASHPTPVLRLATDSIVQFADPEAVVLPAAAFVAASYGDLAVPACVILPRAGVAGVDIALSRQAWRLKDVAGDLALGWADAAAAHIGAPAEPLAPGAIRVVPLYVDRAAAAGAYAVRLSAGARALVHRFELERVG